MGTTNVLRRQLELCLRCLLNSVRNEHSQLQIPDSMAIHLHPIKKPTHHYNYTSHLMQMTHRKYDGPYCFFFQIHQRDIIDVECTASDGDKCVIRLQDVRMCGVDGLPCGRGVITSVMYRRDLIHGMLHG